MDNVPVHLASAVHPQPLKKMTGFLKEMTFMHASLISDSPIQFFCSRALYKSFSERGFTTYIKAVSRK